MTSPSGVSSPRSSRARPRSPRARSFFFTCVFLSSFFSFFSPPAARGQEPSLLWGHVLDAAERPLTGVSVLVRADGHTVSYRTTTDARGLFRFIGLPWGLFEVRFEARGYSARVEDGVVSEPGSRVYLGVVLGPESGGEGLTALRFSERLDFQRTVLNADHIRDHPSGNNIWNLIENQDLAATTSRIDVGGMALGLPAAVSPRGSATWTQTGYALNGLDVTDPFDTGRPLFSPDVFSLSFYELHNACLPVSASYAGAGIGLVTKAPGGRARGSVTAFYSSSLFAADNVTPALIKEGISESHAWDGMGDIHFELSAPLSTDRLGLYASLTSQRLARDPADYDSPDSSSVLSGLLSLEYRPARGSIRLLGLEQSVRHFSLGAGRGVAPETTLDSRRRYGVTQLLWENGLHDGHHLRAGLGYASASVRDDFQEEASGPCRVNILPEAFFSAAPFAGQDNRSLLDAFFEGRMLSPVSSKGVHLLEYGLGFKAARNKSLVHILENRHLRFFQGLPLEVVEFNTPLENGQAAYHGRLYVRETLFLAPMLYFTAGLNIGLSHAFRTETGSSGSRDAEGVSGITWLGVSPRIAFNLPLSRRRDTALSVSAARYPFALSLKTLFYGHHGALGGLVYAWNDLDHDQRFDSGEAGALIRREGPAFAAIDPELKQPYADELVVALKLDLGSGWRLALAGFLRETRHLLGTLNTGVPFSSYEAVTFYEDGDDLISGTHDDLEFTLYNQDPTTLGQDFFLLTNSDAEKRVSRYRGLDLTLVRRHDPNFTFFLALQAIEAIGYANPGNTEFENDDGVIGALDDDPNTLINAKGRLRFDRGYTARLGFSLRLPAGFRLASVVKYYDGQPFARKIVVTGFNQGPFYIMAHTRGVARYEFNLTADIRLEKAFFLGGAELRLFVDAFNVFNSSLAVSENEWTGPEWPLRYATEIQSPRLVRLGASYAF